jgi:hypothetical protein
MGKLAGDIFCVATVLMLAACGQGSSGGEPAVPEVASDGIDRNAAPVDVAMSDAAMRAQIAAAKARDEELQRQTDLVNAAARKRDLAAIAEAANNPLAPAIRAAEEREIERARKEADELQRLQRERDAAKAATDAADG